MVDGTQAPRSEIVSDVELPSRRDPFRASLSVPVSSAVILEPRVEVHEALV